MEDFKIRMVSREGGFEEKEDFKIRMVSREG